MANLQAKYGSKFVVVSSPNEPEYILCRRGKIFEHVPGALMYEGTSRGIKAILRKHPEIKDLPNVEVSVVVGSESNIVFPENLFYKLRKVFHPKMHRKLSPERVEAFRQRILKYWADKRKRQTEQVVSSETVQTQTLGSESVNTQEVSSEIVQTQTSGSESVNTQEVSSETVQTQTSGPDL